MEAVYTRTKTLNGNLLGFCPGCMHGTTFKLIGEVLEELGIDDKASCILAIGCITILPRMSKTEIRQFTKGNQNIGD